MSKCRWGRCGGAVMTDGDGETKCNLCGRPPLVTVELPSVADPQPTVAVKPVPAAPSYIPYPLPPRDQPQAAMKKSLADGLPIPPKPRLKSDISEYYERNKERIIADARVDPKNVTAWGISYGMWASLRTRWNLIVPRPAPRPTPPKPPTSEAADPLESKLSPVFAPDRSVFLMTDADVLILRHLTDSECYQIMLAMQNVLGARAAKK